MADEIQADYIPGGTLDHYAKDVSGDTWYPTGQVFEVWGGGAGRDATDYAVAMVGDAGGNFVGDFDVNTSAGHYYITTKIRAGANAADGDTVYGNGVLWWNGTAEVTQVEYYDGPTNAEMEARTILSASYNTVVPDAAGTAAGLHSTTDGLINTVDTVVDAIKVTTDKFEGMIVIDGAVYQYTANALELAPSSGGSGDTINWTVQVTIS